MLLLLRHSRVSPLHCNYFSLTISFNDFIKVSISLSSSDNNRITGRNFKKNTSFRPLIYTLLYKTCTITTF